MIDHRTLDLARIQRARYVLHQAFTYEYDGPISDLKHRLVLAPPEEHGDQVRLSHALRVEPPMESSASSDPFGNRVVTLRAAYLDGRLVFDYRAEIERTAGIAHRVARREHELRAALDSTRLTALDPALRAWAATFAAQGLAPRALAPAISRAVFTHMRYAGGVTDVFTTAAEAFALGAGVCQDYAHVMLALCRACGLPARYVSGHMLGEGGTHAWVEVLFAEPNAVAIEAFDPTHDRQSDLRYLVVAVGRDYADVAPTSGTYTAAFEGRMSATRTVGITEVAYATRAQAS